LLFAKNARGGAMISGTRSAFSNSACFAQLPCSPSAQPWSPTKVTHVDSASPAASSASSASPIWESTHVTAE
jgi:hypothetical protein